MFVPSGCFLRRGTSQPFWYFSVSEAFFSVGLVQALAVFFPRHPDFSSGIFCVLRMPLAVFFPAIPVFGVSGAFFLFVLCRRLPCFSSVIPIFLRNLLRFTDAACCFFISHSGIFRFPEHFFLPVLCRLLPCFFSVIPIFHPESFAFCGCRLPCFFQPYRHFFPFFVFPAYGKSPAFLLPCGFFARIRRARIRTRVIVY